MRQYPHVMLVPASFMFLTVYAFNRVGERAREAWDPRTAKI
jgi:peptide/nickel transport system permease protein